MPPAPGDRLAPFTLPTLNGSAARRWSPGRVTIISFCAFWCDTWKEQTARLAQTRAALAGLPADYLVVSVDGRWAERARGRLDPAGVLLDAGNRLSGNVLGVRAVPYTLVVDPAGVIRFAFQGIARSADLQTLVRELAGGAKASAGKHHQGTAPVYLTFDDFPASDEDDLLLDALRAASVRATFFCVGEHVAERPALVRRAAAESHALQIHSWSHNRRDPQLIRCARALQSVAAVSPTLYRPPGSDRLLRLPELMPLRPVTVVNPYDFQRPGPAELARRVLLAAKPGAVVLLHAGVGETRTALPGLVRSLRRRGLGFGVLR